MNCAQCASAQSVWVALTGLSKFDDPTSDHFPYDVRTARCPVIQSLPYRKPRTSPERFQDRRMRLPADFELASDPPVRREYCAFRALSANCKMDATAAMPREFRWGSVLVGFQIRNAPPARNGQFSIFCQRLPSLGHVFEHGPMLGTAGGACHIATCLRIARIFGSFFQGASGEKLMYFTQPRRATLRKARDQNVMFVTGQFFYRNRT